MILIVILPFYYYCFLAFFTVSIRLHLSLSTLVFEFQPIFYYFGIIYEPLGLCFEYK